MNTGTIISFTELLLSIFPIILSPALVKKLFVVTCLQHRINGSTSLKTINSPSGIDDGRVSSFLKYGTSFIMYLLLASDGSQNLMPNLSGLFGNS
ncbi:hypothetical protein V1478_018914 [Vespula squamosa]|uniref:Uncharacterized protein n=1 Tax=Vespula squamosa TaxID=30214 RepID=A0ABD1ZU52_VESSQ